MTTCHFLRREGKDNSNRNRNRKITAREIYNRHRGPVVMYETGQKPWIKQPCATRVKANSSWPAGDGESLLVFSCLCSSTLCRPALCNLLDSSFRTWAEGMLRTEFSSLSGENLTDGRKLVSGVRLCSTTCWRSIFSGKITSWYYQIPSLNSINNLFKGASTTTCTL